VKDSRLAGGCCCRYPVVRRSEVDVRCDESRSSENANLIVHHGLVNIIHQIVEFLCILGVIQELCDIFLSCHWVQSLANNF